jgi:hypothetical protein
LSPQCRACPSHDARRLSRRCEVGLVCLNQAGVQEGLGKLKTLIESYN